jgi:hypothetical protein
LVNNPVKIIATQLGFWNTIYGDHIEQLCGWVELQAGLKLITPDIEVMSFSTRRGVPRFTRSGVHTVPKKKNEGPALVVSVNLYC